MILNGKKLIKLVKMKQNFTVKILVKRFLVCYYITIRCENNYKVLKIKGYNGGRGLWDYHLKKSILLGLEH